MDTKNIFKHPIPKNKNCKAIDCKQTKRILLALKHYESFDMNNEKNQDLWIDFVTTKYKHFLDDRNHVFLKHTNEIEDIHTVIQSDNNLKQHLLNCTLKSCALSTRSNRSREKVQETKHRMAKFIFWRDVFDELHSFIIHAFDYGLRVKRSDITATEDNNASDDTQTTEASFTDRAFTTLHDVVQSKRKNVSEIGRLNSNKFTINTSFESENKNHANDEDNKDEDDSNPAYNSFSIGHTFYYWPHYKGKTTEDIDQLEWNRNDRMGHCVSTLFVEQKYASLKTELLTNKIHKVDIHQYLLLLEKGKALMKCKAAKRLKASPEEDLVECYDIESYSAITLNHILCMICYTDFTYLCTAFSATFRAIYKNEPLSSIKKRNSEFWHLSKYIREAVECYGKSLGELQEFGAAQKQRGNTPFYCGISYMLMPSFVVRICSPTSTSKQISVASSFCGGDGIIMQVESNSIWLSASLRTFNCVWLTAFPAEDERLFCGGNYPLRLDSVRLVKESKNFAPFCKALFYFDVGLNGMAIQQTAKKAIRSVDVRIITKLMDGLLDDDDEENKIDDYVKDTFKVFCHHKKEIVMNMEQMNDSLVIFKETLFAEPLTANVVKFKLFDALFIHCKDIIFTEEWNSDHLSIDVKAFATALVPVMSQNNCNFKTVTIKCRRFETDKDGYMLSSSKRTPSWLHTKYVEESTCLETLCEEKQIEVKLSLNDQDEDQYWDVLSFISV